MKKDIISKILIIISIILAIAFVVTIYDDYINKDKLITITFQAAVMVRSIEFLIPSFICCIIGIILKISKRGKTDDEK